MAGKSAMRPAMLGKAWDRDPDHHQGKRDEALHGHILRLSGVEWWIRTAKLIAPGPDARQWRRAGRRSTDQSGRAAAKIRAPLILR